MLRLLVLLLLLANGAYFAWSHDMLGGLGLGVPSQSEPQRLTQQIEPERIRILKPSEAAPAKVASTSNNPSANVPSTAAATTNAAATSCLQAGVFTDKQIGALRQALSNNLPSGSWRLDATAQPAQWIVYMGKYPDNKTRDLKKSQLTKIKVPFETLTEAALEPGISLGSHPSQEAANQALNRLFKQGVRTARVLEEQPSQQGYQLVLPALNDAQRTKLNNVRVQLAGKPLMACKS